ncbi:MAG: peptidoglycan DD-metalloendopeptidase family protein [Eubacteriaceae bacterium]
MNKGKFGKTGRVNLEVKPRSYTSNTNYNPYNNKDELKITKKDKLIFKSIISTIIVLVVFLINNLNTNFSQSITNKINEVITYQVQWNELFKSDIVNDFENRIVSLFNGNTQVFSDTNVELSFLEPVDGHIVNEFEEKTHPVFNTKIEPRGIEYSIYESQSILASCDGVVLNILPSTYQGDRIVIQHEGRYKSVYDGVEESNVTEGQSITEGDKLGNIDANEENPKLFFLEIWNDNIAVDPLTLFSVNN